MAQKPRLNRKEIQTLLTTLVNTNLANMATNPPQPKKSRQFSRWLSIILLGLSFFVGIAATSVGVSVKMENNDAFCAGCHTEPESAYVARAQAADSGDLAAHHAHLKKGVGCIECHSGEGIKGRANALKLGARDLVSYGGGNYPQPAPLTWAIPDGNCTKCHSDIFQSRGFNNHFHFLLPRWQKSKPQAAASCVACHSSHTQDADAQGFLNKQRTVKQCNNCHTTMGD